MCGLLAAHIDGGAEITLRMLPPLEQRLDITADIDGAVELATAQHGALDAAELYCGLCPLGPPNAQACLPMFPVRDVFERRTLRGFEVGANGVGDGHKADLHNVGGNPKKLCRLVTTAQMERGKS